MVKSAYRVTQILEAVSSRRRGLKHSEIVDILKIPKGSLSLLLADLVMQQYLTHDNDDRRYMLGPQVLVIAKRYLAGLDIVRLGEPVLRQLVTDVGECGEIAVKRGNEILMVCREDCSRPLRSVMQIGDRAPLYSTAAGKAILAFLPDEEIDAYLASTDLKSSTRKPIANVKAFKKELEAIRSGGVAYSQEELNEGIVAMGMPVFDLNELVAGSIVVPMPTIRFNPRKEKKVEIHLREAAARLSHQLGHEE
jgi:DNA-binding IclR family transcriptional regulator